MQENSMWKFIPPRERAKLLLMLVALVVLVGSMFGLVMLVKNKTPDPGAVPETAKRLEPAAGEDSPAEDPDDGQKPVIPEPPDEDDAGIDIYDPDILEDVTTDSASDGAAFVLLLHWLQNKTHEQLVEETRADIFVKNLLEEPDKFRGELMYVDGILENVRKRPIDTNSTGIEQVYVGSLKQIGKEATRTVNFCLIDGPLGFSSGEFVVLRGYFLRLYTMKKSGEICPLLVGKRFDPPEWLTDPASLESVRDGGFGREHRAVYYLINKIMGMTAEQITQAVDKSITPTEMKTSPEKVRGKFVSFTGPIIQLRKQVLDSNPTGLSECYVGYLLNTDDQPCMFYVLDNPAGLEELHPARIDGIFMKNYRYVTQRSTEREASVIIGRVLTAGPTLDASNVHLLIFIVCVVGLVALTTAGVIEARAARRRMRESRLKILARAPKNLGAKAREATKRAAGEHPSE